VIRPLDVVVGGFGFYRDSIFYLRFYLSAIGLPSELAERNSTRTDHMFGSECDLKVHVRNLGYPLRLKIEGQKHIFSTFIDDCAA